MGAEASSLARPMTAVDIKNDIGVLFEGPPAEAFNAAAKEHPSGDLVVEWAEVKAYAEKHKDISFLDPKYCLFQNLRGFRKARDEIEEIARREIKGAVREIPWRGKELGDEFRQSGPEGSPAETLDELYTVAELARGIYSEIMKEACEGGPSLDIAFLKGRDRAEKKAHNEYNDKTAPCYSWLFDIVRGSVMCETEDEIVSLYRKLEADERVKIFRIKNRFDPPLFNGYRDILTNVEVLVKTASGTAVKHVCELQIHLRAIKESEPLHLSHMIYEFFRGFFRGNTDAVKERLEVLCDLPVADAVDVDDLVTRTLSSARAAEDEEVCENLCKLLDSISEFESTVRIREQMLVLMKDKYGKDHVKVAVKLHGLGLAYGDLGDYNKMRDRLERALAINEREYVRDHVEVAGTLTNLGNAYGALGDYNKMRDMLERALAIEEREYGRDHVEVAVTLTNLGTAYGALGDYNKARDMLERAHAIFEREYGRDHVNVIWTLKQYNRYARRALAQK